MWCKSETTRSMQQICNFWSFSLWSLSLFGHLCSSSEGGRLIVRDKMLYSPAFTRCETHRKKVTVTLPDSQYFSLFYADWNWISSWMERGLFSTQILICNGYAVLSWRNMRLFCLDFTCFNFISSFRETKVDLFAGRLLFLCGEPPLYELLAALYLSNTVYT